jgi:hypothetical protein
MSEVFTVFFSWQSDTKRHHNRDLIHEALEAAGGAIGKDTDNPYRVAILSDTEGEPGLCNIPETLLRRLRESDAVVSDLTFVAKTNEDEPKYCSNPNVLFELGYAFASIGPERLICVMNEVHGAAGNQIFDLAHHRRPITFTSPRDGTTRKETVDSLSKELEVALRSVIGLGLVGGYGGDDEIRHQRDLSEIRTTYESSGHRDVDYPRIEVVLRPSIFRPKRWCDAGSLEDLVRNIAVPTDGYHRYPPQPTGTAPMDWGIYNDTYGDPWAVTYAGQYWAEFDVGGPREMRLSARDAGVSPEPPDNLVLRPGEWVVAGYALRALSSAFRFALNLSRQFGESEQVYFEFSARNLRGRWLRVGDGESMGPCRAPNILRPMKQTAASFQASWIEHFASMGKDLCDLFCRDGRVLSLEDVKAFAGLTPNN